MAGDKLHPIRHEFIGDRNSLLRIGNIIPVSKLDPLAIYPAIRIDFCNSRFGASLDLRTHRSIRTGQRSAYANQYVRASLTGKYKDRRYRNAWK